MGSITESILKEIRKRFHEKPDLRIGRRGLHQALIDQAKKLLKKRGGIIKVKVLRNIAESRSETEIIARELASRIGANFVKVIGRSIVIADLDMINKRRQREANKQQTLPLMRTR